MSEKAMRHVLVTLEIETSATNRELRRMFRKGETVTVAYCTADKCGPACRCENDYTLVEQPQIEELDRWKPAPAKKRSPRR